MLLREEGEVRRRRGGMKKMAGGDGEVEQGRRAATATRRSRGVGGEVGDLVETAKCCIYSKSIGPGS